MSAIAGIRIDIPHQEIIAFCRKWKIRELSLFGSVLREDFRPDSDVDVLVTFEDGAPWSLFDFVDMKDELMAILGREVDLVEEKTLENPYRRHSILQSKRVVYAA